MNDQKQQLVEKLKSSSNILVTVRNNPTVDQLSACIGLTLLLNKLNKHATAVFSGEIPSTIEFLKPEETLEKTTDSLRDFIIALDKSKADKLRYKVEDTTVKIFITPFRTSISQDDLDFSQGDFNVDVVVALGAHEQQDLDRAITEHGRILHDATVVSINNTENGSLGTINWIDTRASSLSELVAGLTRPLGGKDKNLLDEQVATALLTGIVAETERFSNDRTTPQTMSISADLMSAGANQQLVASQLETEPETPFSLPPESDESSSQSEEPPKPDDGTLEIKHNEPAERYDDRPENVVNPPIDLPKPETEPQFDSPEMFGLPPKPAAEDKLPEIKPLHEHETMLPTMPPTFAAGAGDITGLPFQTEVPSGSPANPNAPQIDQEPMLDTLNAGLPPSANPPLLSHNGEPAKTGDAQSVTDASPAPVAPSTTFTPTQPPVPEEPPLPPAPSPEFLPYNAPPEPEVEGRTLAELEQEVHSPHAAQPGPTGVADVDSARDEVLKALEQAPGQPLEPIAALNAQPLGADLHSEAETPNMELHVDKDGNLDLPQFPEPPAGPSNEPAPSPQSPADQPMDMPLPPTINMPPPQTTPPTNQPGTNPNAPPPVPPPMMPNF